MNDFLQLAQDTSAALRFAANVLVLCVHELRARQRRLANRAETREKRKQRGQCVKTPPELRRELYALALQFDGFGRLLVSCISQLQMVRGSLAKLLTNAIDVHNTDNFLSATANQFTDVLPLLAEHSSVMVHQPLQVLKKGNKFALKVHWLAGPVVAQFGVQFQLVNARLVPELALSGEPSLAPPPADQRAAVFLSGTTSQLVHPRNAQARHNAAGQQPGQYVAWEAKFSELKYETPPKADKRGKGKKGQQAEEMDEDEEDSVDDSMHSGHSARAAGPKARVTERLHFVVVESEPIAQLANVRLRAVSLPVVLTVSVNQECLALCTVMWRNAFGRQDDVPWSALRDELSALFEAKTIVFARPNIPRPAAASRSSSSSTSASATEARWSTPTRTAPPPQAQQQ